MNEGSPTRSRLIALRQEQRAMQEGYAFLDEKCLILAGAMLRELRRHDTLLEALAAAQRETDAALQAAVARHGIEGLSVYPPDPGASLGLSQSHESLIGIVLRRVELVPAPSAPVAAAVYPSPEAEACRSAFVALARAATALAASVGNLVRLEREYRRTVRRASSLHDVVLPELEREAAAIAGQLEELERDEALWVRAARREL
ncbi:V-type ATP synthase subunit D [Azoarcus sp. Aa7]|nr:V-type ATP synthase subunit D [Azoarcus sp. Aa7]